MAKAWINQFFQHLDADFKKSTEEVEKQNIFKERAELKVQNEILEKRLHGLEQQLVNQLKIKEHDCMKKWHAELVEQMRKKA